MSKPGSFPAIRCHVGDWAYFTAVLPFRDIASRIRRTDEVHKNKGLNDMIQRALTNRVDGIAEYLKTQKERFFNAIVVGIYGGEPNWLPIEIEEIAMEGLPPLTLTQRSRESIGLLQLSGTERLFAIDGQHRVEGIKRALSQRPALEDEELAVLFVAHRVTDDGLARTRRLFTTLNKYAKPVTLSEIIALDEDDAFAVVTRMVVNEYPGLARTNEEPDGLTSLVRFGQGRIPRTDKHSVTTIDTLYKLLVLLAFPYRDRKSRMSFKKARPCPETIDSLYENHVSFWELLRTNVDSMREALGSNPSDRIAGRYRSPSGGSVIFRPAGQVAFARAVRTLQDRGIPLSEAVAALSQTQLAIDQPPWTHVLWDPSTKSMVRVKFELAESLFLYMVRHAPRRSAFDLEQSFQDTVGENSIKLRDIPRSSPPSA